jgi:alpha,alpha-trehalase
MPDGAPQAAATVGASGTTDGWVWAYDGYSPADVSRRESLLTVGNGRFATRGAFPEVTANGRHYPGTYLAGLFNRLDSSIGGRTVTNESLVNLPNWLALRFRLSDGEWFAIDRVSLIEHREELDLRSGILTRRMVVADEAERETEVVQRRLVSLDDSRFAALETTFRARNWQGRLTVRSLLDGHVRNAGVARYEQLRGDHLRALERDEISDDSVLLLVETTQSLVRVAEAARTRVSGPARLLRRSLISGTDEIGHELEIDLPQGEATTVEKVVALTSSRDPVVSEAAADAEHALSGAPDFAGLAKRHEAALGRLWARCALDLDCPLEQLQILRLHTFHMLQTVSPLTGDLHVGIPARGLHGEAYRGHIFWDELFMLPFYDLRLPSVSRELLQYRVRRIGAARRAAREVGLAGALFPWQSGSDGREESQELHLNPRSGRWLPDHSRLQRHVNAAIAYNVWHHFQCTGEREAVLSSFGATLLLEIARMWASLAQLDHVRSRYVIRGVVGPDEFHDAYPGSDRPGIDNNAYTNVMAVWCIDRALEALSRLSALRQSELREELGLTDAELARFEDVATGMFVPLRPNGIIAQFEGYDDLEELDWEQYRARYGNVQRLDRILEAEGDSVNRYQVTKQADLLMLFYLFSAEELASLFSRMGYGFDAASIPGNIDHYLARTSHGSTLSGVVHSWVMARADRPRADRLFSTALASDVEDIQGGTTGEGVHLSAMAGTVDLVQRAFSGLEARADALRLNPRLPDRYPSLGFPIDYRGHLGMRIEVDHERVRVSAPPSEAAPVTLVIGDEHIQLAAGETVERPVTGGAGQGPDGRAELLGRARQRRSSGRSGRA